MVFKETTAAHIIEKAEKDVLGLGGKIVQRYTEVMKGFSALIPDHIMQALSTNPDIDYIEEDSPGKKRKKKATLARVVGQEMSYDEQILFGWERRGNGEAHRLTARLF